MKREYTIHLHFNAVHTIQVMANSEDEAIRLAEDADVVDDNGKPIGLLAYDFTDCCVTDVQDVMLPERAEKNKAAAFEFGGRTFIPCGTFWEWGVNPEFKDICAFTSVEGAFRPDGYTHEKFYRAADCLDDVFYCIEKSGYYLPTNKNFLKWTKK